MHADVLELVAGRQEAGRGVWISQQKKKKGGEKNVDDGVVRSARLLQRVNDLLQDVGTVVCDLLQDRVGVLLQLGTLSLTLLQLRFQLRGKHQNVRFIHSDLPLYCLHLSA